MFLLLTTASFLHNPPNFGEGQTTTCEESITNLYWSSRLVK